MDPKRFFSELRRRKVFRVAGVYAISAFVVLQVADLAVEPLALPLWTMSLLWLLVLAAFPIALVLAWAFEVTPEGVKRTEVAHATRSGEGEAKTGGGAPPSTGASRRQLGIVFGVGVVVALLALGAYAALGGRGAGPAAEATDGTAEPTDPSAETTGAAVGPLGSGEAALDRSIAVLPLENLSPDPDNAFFAAGIHEEILTQLSKIGDLRVLSRTSVARFAADARHAAGGKSIREIGGELGARAVVEGSVQRVGDRVRVTVQLIDARTDEHLWAERYDRELDDVFAIQSEIALAIAEALHARLSAGERQRIEERPTENLAAYDLYLRGLELYARGSEENETAIELFRQAIELDPSFPHAYAMMASAYMQRVQTYGFPRAWADSGIARAQQAIALAPDLANGHQALGSNLHQLGRHGEAVAAFRRALELNPSSSPVLVNLSVAAIFRGRFDESIRWASRAVPLDPASPYPTTHLAADYWFLGLEEQAERWLERTLALAPGFPFAHEIAVQREIAGGEPDAALARAESALEEEPGDHYRLVVAADAALYTGRYDDAARRYERILRRVPDGRHPITGRSYRAGLAFARLKAGSPGEAEALFDAALEGARAEMARGNEMPGLPLEIAAIHSARGDREEAYRWLERAYEAGWRQMPVLEHDPLLEPLRGEERFERLLGRVREDLADMRRRVEESGLDVLRLP